MIAKQAALGKGGAVRVRAPTHLTGASVIFLLRR